MSSGAAENTKLTVNLLDRERFQPFIATLPGQTMEAELAPDVIRLPLRYLRRSVGPVWDLLALAELYGAIRQYRFDIVHTHNAKDGILGRWAARFAKTPGIVHTIHNVSFHASTSAFLNRQYAVQERWAARFTDRLLAVSETNTAKYLARKIGRPEQYQTVYSGLEFQRYADEGLSPSELRTTLGLPDVPGPWVGWIGRFNPQKDPLTFVRAADLVRRSIPSVEFVVCGDDPLRLSLLREVHSIANAAGLREKIHFLGFRRDIGTVLRGIDVLMHSSRYEGMGRVVCEALACGRPVAATAVDGVTEVIDSGRRGGILSPAGDPVGLAQATLRLLADTSLARALADSGRQWVIAKLSADRMVRAIEQVYFEVLATKNQPNGAVAGA